MIAIDLGKQQVPDCDPKARQQITVTGNLNQSGNKTIFAFLKKQKKAFWIFDQKPLNNLFCFNMIGI